MLPGFGNLSCNDWMSPRTPKIGGAARGGVTVRVGGLPIRRDLVTRMALLQLALLKSVGAVPMG